MNEHPTVVAITGASGAMYAVRLLQTLCAASCDVHLTISPSGAAVIKQELEFTIDCRRPNLNQLVNHKPSWSDRQIQIDESVIAKSIHFHQYDDYMTPIASGSFRTRAMVVCPCRGSTLSGIARAAASNLIPACCRSSLERASQVGFGSSRNPA